MWNTFRNDEMFDLDRNFRRQEPVNRRSSIFAKRCLADGRRAQSCLSGFDRGRDTWRAFGKHGLVRLQLPRQLQYLLGSPKRSKVMKRRTCLVQDHLAAPFRIGQTFPGSGHIGGFYSIRSVTKTVSQMPVIEDLAAKFGYDTVHASFNSGKVATENSHPIKSLQSIFLI